jgi:Zn finger protein HypA/HybF involved in hydrogenase expression
MGPASDSSGRGTTSGGLAAATLGLVKQMRDMGALHRLALIGETSLLRVLTLDRKSAPFSVSVMACYRQLALQSFAMYCPKCGDVLKEEEGTFTCLRGDMPLSQYMAVHLYSCFVSRTEEPKEFQFTTGGYSVGGLWFCPGCGVVMREETPGAVRCPECRRNIGSFLHGLIELHPHRPIEGLGR